MSRPTSLMDRPSLKKTSAFFIFVSAFLLALPLPIPATNSPPAYAIFLLSLGFLERDALIVVLGYAFFWGTIAYFAFLGWASAMGIAALIPS